MTTLYPLIFHPIFKERIWGGRAIEKLYGKKLPADVPIGESWEISDRPGDASVIANGPLAGKDLRWLMEHHERELLGNAKSANGRFPLLIKILDAQEKLSLQVHPPAAKAAELKGEPKTEAWYIADAAPGAELYVGLKNGVTRAEFQQKIRTGAVAECFHRVPVKAGDTMFLPSGRVHAIGAGLVIFEIQQNSDTTYRVFDWNRVGLDKKPRELHVAESLASIDFEDFEPGLVSGSLVVRGGLPQRTLVSDPLFEISEFRANSAVGFVMESGRPHIVAVVKGKVHFDGAQVSLTPGGFALVPAEVSGVSLVADKDSVFLMATAG
ncbi:MAG TPA: type I phosphomannose isomerase catalytic subunit [Verrucomicrobiae bacterium]|nr:type I phosphomannose isomerase catalytic subunit [Verrucomicrobiae bacterium]